MELLALLFFWVVFSHVIAAVLPELARGIGYLIGFLFICLWEVVKFVALAAVVLMRHGAAGLMRVGRGLRLGLLFLFYLADEWRRGPDEEAGAAEEEFSGAAPDDDEPSAADAYDQALALLGLAPGFTQDVLKRAYRTAISKAHPDAGGTDDAAQAVNGAYELILQAHGWAR